MQRKKNNRRFVLMAGAWLAFAVLLAVPWPVAAWQASEQRPSREKDPIEEKIERDMKKAANKERHESLKKDTDKLLELATELKENVDKSNEHMLSLEVIRKAEEIEKLAKRVKDKMKTSY